MTEADTARARVPAIEGWFTMDEADPRLIGTKDTESGTYFFPPETTMSRAPGFADAPLEEVLLSNRGTLWSYTSATYQPPNPYIPVSDPFEPFCIAAVHLDAEQIVVLGQVVAGVQVDDLAVGQEMELVLDVLYSDDQADHIVWKWRPAKRDPSSPEVGQ